jgi:hypothetical protein
MSTPAWILEIFGGVMILVAELSAGQLVAARAWTRRGSADADIAVSRLLTGIAIAGMLVPGLSTLPNAAWEVVFAVMTAWFAWRRWREGQGRAAAGARGHYAPPLVQNAAMVYIFAALAGPAAEGSGMSMSGPGGMPGMTSGSSSGMPTLHAPTLALIFALLLIAFTVYDLDQPALASGAGPVVTVTPRQPAQPDAADSAPGADPAADTAQRLLLSAPMMKGCRVAMGVTMALTLIIMI